MYIAVIPFSHSLSITPFTYSVPPLWEAGIVLWWLVEIPFGKTVDQGIIVEISRTDEHREGHDSIRPIERVIASVRLIAPYQIQVILLLAQRYLIPIHRVLKMMLPAPLMTRLEKRNYVLMPGEKYSDSWAVYSIIHAKDHPFSGTYLSEYTIPGSVILFPDDYFLYSFLEKRDDIRSIAAESSPVQKAKSWIDAYEGNIPIFVWTRRLLYYNLSCYSHIYYIEDSFWDEDYQYPSRIRNLDILRCIANQKNINITILTSTATLELFAKFRDFHISTSSR